MGYLDKELTQIYRDGAVDQRDDDDDARTAQPDHAPQPEQHDPAVLGNHLDRHDE